MFEIQGVLLDPARLTETRKTYRDYITKFERWGFNTLVWHFTDDEGCALRFPRRRELASRHAYSQREMRELIEFARGRGISIIPEVECFGHTGYITRKKRYAHLRDGAPGKFFGAICPFHPDARAILEDILADTAETFDSEYIHVGLDEVGFGSNPVSARLLRTRKKYELFAEHAKWLHGVVSKLGRKMMMWGDHLQPPSKVLPIALDVEAFNGRIADAIPKDVVICDWHYNPKPDPGRLDFFINKGFQVVACPATVAWEVLGHPRQSNLDNLRDFSAVAAPRSGRGVIGMINTVWTPPRNFPGTTLYGVALAAQYQRTGGKAPSGFDKAFVKETFGVAKPGPLAAALRKLHQVAPHTLVSVRAMPVRTNELEETTVEHVRALASLHRQTARMALQLESIRKTITRNHSHFDDLLFTVRCYASAGARPAQLVRVSGLMKKGRYLAQQGKGVAAKEHFRRAADALDAMSGEAARLYQESVKRWNKSRFADDPKRDGGGKFSTFDALVERLCRSAKLFAMLSREAQRLARTGKGKIASLDTYPKPL